MQILLCTLKMYTTRSQFFFAKRDFDLMPDDCRPLETLLTPPVVQGTAAGRALQQAGMGPLAPYTEEEGHLNQS